MKFLAKTAVRLVGLVLTVAVLMAAVSIVTDRASRKFADNGAYSSALLTWEQDYADSGRLVVLGKSFRLDLGSIRKTSAELFKACADFFRSVTVTITEAELQNKPSR